MLYVQAAKDPSKALVLEEATLSWRRACPGVVNGALELERNGHAAEPTPGAQPLPGALGPEDTEDSLAPALHRINLAVSKVASSCQAGRPASGRVGLRLGAWPGVPPFPRLETVLRKPSFKTQPI